MNPTALQTGETLLFIGDSITAAGRHEPATSPLGCGYVNFFAHLLTVREPAKHVKIINRGIGGNTAEDLYSRWTDDALIHKPDWLSVKIGINDCCRNLEDPEGRQRQLPASHRDYLERSLERTQAALPGVKLLLITPFYLSRETASDAHRGRIREHVKAYHQNVCELAQQFDARLLDTQAMFEQFMAHRTPSDISHDMVHLNVAGALFLAEGVYNALAE
ncbi:MAG: SGNH/GDSL hydrolase family protein [Puniceicoccales bacterium]